MEGEIEVERASKGETEVLVLTLPLRDGDLDLLSIESPSFIMRPFFIEKDRSL